MKNTKKIPASFSAKVLAQMFEKQSDFVEFVQRYWSVLWKRVNKDDLRAMIDGGQWSKKNEEFILLMRDYLIQDAIRGGYNVVVDDTNFEPKHKEHIKILLVCMTSLKDFEYESVEKYFDITLEEAVTRDSHRPNPVGIKVIKGMYDRYIKPLKPEITPLPYLEGLPDAVICDLDGTLATMGDRGPFDWKRVGEDTINPVVETILSDVISMRHHKLLIVSGRDGICRPETEQWLKDHAIPYTELFMRPAGNNEKDSVIKKRIFEGGIQGKYNVAFVLDDRDQVVKMWRELGLTCLQVNEGDF